MHIRTLLPFLPGMTLYLPIFLTIFLHIFHTCSGASAEEQSQRSERSWDDVWSYDGLQAPEYWGNLHSAWRLCEHGKRQSPIDLQADRLLYDPDLQRLEMETTGTVPGVINNTGRGLSFTVDPAKGSEITLSEGPLSYKYAFHAVYLHFGPSAEESQDMPKIVGSEHTVNGKAYPAEIQLAFYNKELYDNYEAAIKSPQGLAYIGIFVLIGNETTRELNKLTGLDKLRDLVYKGSSVMITDLNVRRLLPETTDYVTYEGSLTTPGCYETVTWIVMNKPLYITAYSLDSIRESLRTPKGAEDTQTIGKNFRPTQELGFRSIRTNIARKFTSVTETTKKCPQYRRQFQYKVNRLPRRL